MSNHKKEEEKEMIYCKTKTCRHNKGRGKCEIADPVNGEGKISMNAQGVCENFFTE